MCRSWRKQHPEMIEWLDTDNRHYATDIDTPEDLQRFEAETGHALVWPSAQLAAPNGAVGA
jgi:hypothetical protein